MNVEQLVTFAILMGAGDSILNKSPDYILEKLEACNQVSSEPFLRQLLDRQDATRFDVWMRRWMSDL